VSRPSPRALACRLRARWLEVLLVAVTAAHLGMIVPRSHAFLIDDAFITFRYAQHYAVGHPDFNRHQPRERWVEANTSLLWTLVLVPFEWLGLPLPAAAQALGVACWIGVVALAGRLATRGLGGGGAFAAFLAANAFPFLFYATSGMDSMAYALLVLAFAGALADAPAREDRRSRRVLAGLALLVVLVRPEGIAVVLASLAAAWLLARRGGRALLATAGVSVAAQSLLVLARLAIYGQPFPNTFYAKYAGQLSSPWAADELFGKLVTFLAKAAGLYRSSDFPEGPPPIGPWALLGLAAAVSFRRWQGREGDRELGRRAAILRATCGVALVPAVLFQPDVLLLERFAFPSYALLLAFLGAALARVRDVPGRAVRAALLGATTALLLLYAFANLGRHGVYLDAFENTWYESNRHRRLAKALRREFPETRLVAFNEMGAVPYYSGFDALDVFGLCDVTVARLLATRDLAGVVVYVLSRRPDLVILTCERLDDHSSLDAFEHPLVRAFLTDPAFLRAYRPVLGFRRAYKEGWIVYQAVRGE
jgi:MYXO-CTERM domain-containing protein